jgi:hypothetical protein
METAPTTTRRAENAVTTDLLGQELIIYTNPHSDRTPSSINSSSILGHRQESFQGSSLAPISRSTPPRLLPQPAVEANTIDTAATTRFSNKRPSCPNLWPREPSNDKRLREDGKVRAA